MADTTPTLREAAQQFVQDYENGDLGDLKHYARSMRAALAEQAADGWCDIGQANKKLRRLLTTAPAAEQAEPVAPYAWLQRGEFGGCTTERLFLVSEFPDMDRRAWIDSVTILPLYLAAPPAPARQDPLSREAIAQIINESREAEEGPTALVRRVERAHGITAAPAEGEKR